MYLIALDLAGRLCVVVGGGAVASRKVRGLLAAGARVRLVAPEATAPLRRLARAGRIAWRRRRFRPADVAGAVLAFAATDDAAANRAVAAAARRRRIPVNVADSASAVGPLGFHVPAVRRRGPITLAVSTGGAAPALAARLAERAVRVVGAADVAAVRGAARRFVRE